MCLWKPLGLSSSVTPHSLCDLGQISQPLFNFFLCDTGVEAEVFPGDAVAEAVLKERGGKASRGLLVGN